MYRKYTIRTLNNEGTEKKRPVVGVSFLTLRVYFAIKPTFL